MIDFQTELAKIQAPLNPALDFISTGGGGSGAGGGINFPGGGPAIGYNPPVAIGIGGGGGSSAGSLGSAITSNIISQIFGMGAGDLLLRVVFLILGLLCIAGAIYLYKPTSEIIAAPARAVKNAAVGAAVAA